MASLGGVRAENVKAAPLESGRFGFGENWSRFASVLEPVQVDAARRSVEDLLGLDSLEGMSFLDVGSGSGLFSLAASQLGAKTVHSLDYDPLSVETTASLRGRLAPGSTWKAVERGSALDGAYMASLGHVGRRLFLGCPAPHRADVGCAREHLRAVAPGGRWWSRSTTTKGR